MLAFRRNICLIVLMLCLCSAAWAQNVTHEVKEGETLFRISKQYGVSVAMILENNAGVTPETLHVGDKLTIPTFSSQSTPLKEYKTRRGETFYSIAKANGLTVEQLAEYNRQISAPDYKIRRGTILFIPEVAEQPKEKGIQKQAGKRVKPTEEEAVTEAKSERKGDQVRVALVLPLKSSKGEGKRSVEFYRGFLLSVEQFKATGADIEIYAFDEGTANDSINELLRKIGRLNVDLLIAPVYFSHFHSIGKFAKSEDTRVVIPFTSKAPIIENHPNVYMLNTPETVEAEEVEKLITAHTTSPRYIFLDYLNGNKKDFAAQLKAKLMRRGDDVQSIEFPTGTQSVADILATDKENILIPNNSNAEAIGDFFQLIDGIADLNPDAKCSLLGYATWADYLKSHLMERLGKSIYYIANTFHNENSAPVIKFENAYRRWFKSEMLPTTPRMALLGYDCGTYFITDILAGKKRNFFMEEAQLLQSNFKFNLLNEDSGRVNAGVWLMHYLPDGSLQKCSY